jgi:hypothetical protein
LQRIALQTLTGRAEFSVGPATGARPGPGPVTESSPLCNGVANARCRHAGIDTEPYGIGSNSDEIAGRVADVHDAAGNLGLNAFVLCSR